MASSKLKLLVNTFGIVKIHPFFSGKTVIELL